MFPYIVLGVCLGVIVFVLLQVVAAIMVQAPYYPYYKKTYAALPNMQLYVCNSLVCNYNAESNGKDPKNEFIYFIDNGSIKLIGPENAYIHNSPEWLIDPYTKYYYKKITQWLADNVDIASLPKY